MTMRILEISSPLAPFYFHGTARRDHRFMQNRVAYFIDSFEQARQHAQADAEIDGGIPVVITVRVRSRKPIVLDEPLMQDLHWHEDQVAELRSDGYDVALGGSSGELCVLDPSIIQVVRIT